MGLDRSVAWPITIPLLHTMVQSGSVLNFLHDLLMELSFCCHNIAYWYCCVLVELIVV